VLQASRGPRPLPARLVQITAAFTPFEHQRWNPRSDLQHERLLLTGEHANERSLCLDPSSLWQTSSHGRPL